VNDPVSQLALAMAYVVSVPMILYWVLVVVHAYALVHPF
jgi:hypothetical protein